MDYITVAVQQLTWRPGRQRLPNPGPQQFKYAVLHLQAAAEILLKAMLLQEDWTQIFRNPEEATREALESGVFQSCNRKDSIKRLKRGGVDIGRAEQDLDKLAAFRNPLQHFGLPAPIAEIRALTASVLDFLVSFVDETLIPRLGGQDAGDAEFDLANIVDKLPELKEFITVRMNRLQGEGLRKLEIRTVVCPFCKQWALVVDNEGPGCLCCTRYKRNWGENLPADYAASVLGVTTQFGENSRIAVACPRCGDRALVPDVVVAAARATPRRFCFSCGSTDET
ncbi:hypothetical protein [Streptacidiphilus anmyonensis]|uniref:hypothetical protein n=1 Tax=Streptacidiphilus anmyonensis TaxID=405782 RepID=UPI00128E6456|nr:hypothetical protein [Streptacidiphilus anmyonensis]